MSFKTTALLNHSIFWLENSPFKFWRQSIGNNRYRVSDYQAWLRNTDYRFSNDIKATIKNATPAQNRLPVRNQTTTAIMAAGRIKSKILTTKIIMRIPKTSSIKRSANSYTEGSCINRDDKACTSSQFFSYLKTLNFSFG